MKTKPWLKTGIALAALHCSPFALAAREGWTSDFAAAKKEAADSKKDLLLDFTGSDWCPLCIKLQEEVFSRAPFKDGVKDKFVLVELDFPRDGSSLKQETISQNEALGKEYGVTVFPTILLCDAGGKPYAATTYQEGGPETYVKGLDELRGRKATRDLSFAAASRTGGVEKAKALVAGLSAMGLDDGMVRRFYGDVVSQIKESDPNDESGFAKAAATTARLEKFRGELGEFGQRQDFEGALGLVDKTLKEGGFDAGVTQKMMMTRAMILVELRKFDEAIKAVDEAKAVDPIARNAGAMDEFKGRIEGAKAKAAGALQETPAKPAGGP